MSNSVSIGASLSSHMLFHVLLMNAAAPVAALWALCAVLKRFRLGGFGLTVATFFQIVFLWGWHAPSVLEYALSNVPRHLMMQFSLFAAASVFWFAVFSQRNADRWRAILALLATSKLYCLLGVLIMFAPVSLYSGAELSHGHKLDGLSDQQLAGLVMLLACPPTYLLIGIIIAAQWICELAQRHHLAWMPDESLASSQGN
jgi:putative membrane protein